MAWIFGDFRLDPERFELSCGAELVRLEPQVLALLCLLVRHHDRMVTKDEIVEKIWLGQGVSDASISSRIRSASTGGAPAPAVSFGASIAIATCAAAA